MKRTSFTEEQIMGIPGARGGKIGRSMNSAGGKLRTRGNISDGGSDRGCLAGFGSEATETRKKKRVGKVLET